MIGVAIDYLLMIFRFRDELREGKDAEPALVETMTHAGRSVILSGSTVAVGLLSLMVGPVPFIRSMGIGGMVIPAVSVLASLILLPALLAVLGARRSLRRFLRRDVDSRAPASSPQWGTDKGHGPRQPKLAAAMNITRGQRLKSTRGDNHAGHD